MESEDHAKAIERDGFYVFAAELQGLATLQVAGANNLEKPNFAIPIDQAISLERIK